MSHYVHCPYCGEDGRDVDTGICGCNEEKAAEAKAKVHVEAVERVIGAARWVQNAIAIECGPVPMHLKVCYLELCSALAGLDAARRG